MKLKNDLVLRAAKGETTERTPVWLMRQAGRILPEYRAVREQAGGFIEMVKTPEFAAEVTIQPVDILGVDAAIIFSDILVIPEAMGLPYRMVESKGPWFDKTVNSKADIDQLHIADGRELKYVTDAISLTKENLVDRVPLIGFAGAPWTIFSYMIEGRGSKTFSEAKKFLYTEPSLSHSLLEKITDSTIHYLNAQIDAGADMLQLFDSWAGILSPQQYTTFALPYIEKICQAVNRVPVTVFAKGAFFAREEMKNLSCRTIGLDWNMNITESRKLIGAGKTLQGNLDPCVLYASEEVIQQETEKMLQEFKGCAHIANLGHGLYPDIEKSKVKFFIDCIKNFNA